MARSMFFNDTAVVQIMIFGILKYLLKDRMFSNTYEFYGIRTTFCGETNFCFSNTYFYGESLGT